MLEPPLLLHISYLCPVLELELPWQHPVHYINSSFSSGTGHVAGAGARAAAAAMYWSEPELQLPQHGPVWIWPTRIQPGMQGDSYTPYIRYMITYPKHILFKLSGTWAKGSHWCGAQVSLSMSVSSPYLYLTCHDLMFIRNTSGGVT